MGNIGGVWTLWVTLGGLDLMGNIGRSGPYR